MSLLIILTVVTLLLASCNAFPRGGMSISIPPECQETTNSSLWENFCFARPDGYDEIERNFSDLLPPFMQNHDTERYHDTYSFDETLSPNYKENDNCPFTATWEPVYLYKKPNQTKLDIIVQAKTFPQKLLKVQCKSKAAGGPGVGGKCFTRLGLSGFGTEFECRESIATRSLIIYDPETHTLKRETYPIPVCCSCHVKSL
uniref:Spaetzle domain-containing protein n=1 Tax=Heliothis virescens TaxID=7102 RepID=A0A2A4K1L4_HELVI